MSPLTYPNWKLPLFLSSNSKKPWTSALIKSSSHSVMETMCQCPVKGDSDCAFDLAIVLLHFVLVLIVVFHSWPFFRDIGNQPFSQRLLLKLPFENSGIHKKAIELNHPGHRILLDSTAKRPCWVHRPDFQHRADRFRLPLASAFRDTKCLVDHRQLHVRGLRFVIEEIDPADGSHDPARPCFRFAAEEWRWPLACQFLRQFATENRIFLVQMLTAELFDQSSDLVEDGWNFLRLSRTIGFSLCHDRLAYVALFFRHILELLPLLLHPFFIFPQGLHVSILPLWVPVAERGAESRMPEDQCFSSDFLETQVGEVGFRQPACFQPHRGQRFLTEQFERRIEDSLTEAMDRRMEDRPIKEHDVMRHFLNFQIGLKAVLAISQNGVALVQPL